MFSIKQIETTQLFNEVGEEWKNLELQVPNLAMFSTYDFLFSFWLYFENFNHSKFGIKKKLKLLFVYQNNTLSAIVPLCLIVKKRKKVFNVSYLELLGQQFFTSSLDIIAKNWNKEIHEFLQDWIFKNIKYDILNFELITENSKLFNSFDLNDKFFYNISPEIILDQNTNYDFFKSHVMSPNYRGILNNSVNKLKKNKIELKFIWKDFELNDLSNIEYLSSSKLRDGKYNIYEYKEMRDFVISINKSFNAKVGYVLFNDKITSYQIYLYFRDQCMWFDLSYDRDFSKYRPGILQYNLALENLLNANIKINTLGYGFDQNKISICNSYKKLYNVIKPGNKLLSKYWYKEKKIAAKEVEKLALEKI
ncbi:MAG: hypothetical protein ACK5QC_11775 [Bacteroidota bacterium]